MISQVLMDYYNSQAPYFFKIKEKLQMETSLKDISESFEVSEQIIMICLQKNPSILDSWSRKEKDTLYFHPKGVDGIEELISDYENKRFTFDEITKGLDISLETLENMINLKNIKFDTLRKSSKFYSEYSIKGIELGRIITELNEIRKNSDKDEKGTAMPIKKRNSAKPKTKTSMDTVEPTTEEKIEVAPDTTDVNTDVKPSETETADIPVENTDASTETSSESNAVEEPKTKTPRKSRKAKTVKANPMTEEMAQEIMDSLKAYENKTKVIRQFMLDSNEMTIEEMAISDDKTVEELFYKKHVALAVHGKLIILSAKTVKNALMDSSVYPEE